MLSAQAGAPVLMGIPQSAPNAAPGIIAAPGGADGIELSIRFYDKRLYYPESEIPIKVAIANTTAQTYRFKLAEDRTYSLSFDARTPANRALDVADDYKRALATTRPIFYREIVVEPGEEYSFVENLARYIRVTDPGSYNIRASFWPELVATAPGAQPMPGTQAGAGAQSAVPAQPILSNILILTVRPSLGLPPASENVSVDTGAILRPEPVAPDEVVTRTIVARQRARWNEFFLYLDLEALLSRDESRKRAYDRESDDGRRRLIERYKADLRTNVIDVDIVTIPSSFEVIETRYSANSGVVRVTEKFDYRTFKMVKEYDYELARRDNIWYIVGYSVLNKGTE
jgi:hypothetical protein